MRTSKFSDSEIQNAIEKINQGASVGDISQRMGVTIATIYNWKKKYGKRSSITAPPASDDQSTLVSLEEENLKLKQLIGSLLLEKQDLLAALNRKQSKHKK